ncbi:MAG: phytanoyl-CoA dioxygenase family protein [Flavobacteriales bacterium]|nr:phytanoyl-CoA dioxygenase family protein [Flavobacteriales bacterium]
MKNEISKEQQASYRKNGFLIIDDFLAPDELETWKSKIDFALSERKGQKFPHSKVLTGESDGINDSADYFGKVFDQIINLWKTSTDVKELILDKRIGKMACDLAEVDGIRVWHDQSLVKQPWANATAWHLDTPFWSFSHREALSIWVALEDVTIQNGCLYFMPESNHDTKFDEPGIGANMGDIFNDYPKYKTVDPVPLVIKAGSCSFHNGLNIHAAGANMTAGTRKAMTCAFMPDGSTFNGNKNVLPQEYFESLKIGDVLNNEEQNPLIYHTNWDKK